jgi:hypothetical protein
MDYENEERWPRQKLIKRLHMCEAFEDSYIKVIKLTCKKVSAEEARTWGNFFQFDGEFYLHPEPYKGVDKPN